MANAWYIDTLDALAGFAFASNRGEDLNSDVALSESADTYFIEAPHFVAERVISRAIAFGASRGRFQTGLYVGGREVAFPSLSAVCEFVRRCYGSGGGSDEGPGALGPLEPPPDQPEFPPELPSRGEFPRESAQVDPVNVLQTAFSSFEERVESQNAGVTSGELSSFFGKIAPRGIDGRSSALRLARAAFRLILETIRYSVAGSPAERLVADQSGRKLHACISRMGLWIHIRELIERDINAKKVALAAMEQSPAAYLYKELTDYYEVPSELATVMFLALRLQGDGAERPLYQSGWWLSRYGSVGLRDIWELVGPVGPSFDRFADLSDIPIPLGFLPQQYRSRGKAPTIRNLIAFACNSPTLINPAYRGDVCETLLFSACYLTLLSTDDIPIGNVPYWGPWGMTISEAELMGVSRMVASALAWLANSFPSCAFNHELEKIIADSASLRRNANPGPSV